jgi:hypothetical protein
MNGLQAGQIPTSALLVATLNAVGSGTFHGRLWFVSAGNGSGRN